MSSGHALGVQSNPWHEAYLPAFSLGDIEAYPSCLSQMGAACVNLRDSFQPHLVWAHSIRNEPRYVDPFKAILDATCLQWEVLQDLHHWSLDRHGYWPHDNPPEVEHSQRPHSKLQKKVQFEDHIEVHIGMDECLAMSQVRLHCSVIKDWIDKPWSRKRIRPKKIINNDLINSSHQTQEPLSFEAVSSRVDESGPHDFQDAVSFVQGYGSTRSHYKQSPFADGDDMLLEAFHQGHAQAPIANDESATDSEHSNSASSSADDLVLNTHDQQNAGTVHRQEVILYHLNDLPIHTFLNWNGYDEMMQEIAHHYGVERELLIEAYEVVTPLPDLDGNIVPIVVHMRYDFPSYHLSRLVLLDLEFHGNRVEDHFQLGPVLARKVIVTPVLTSRYGLLRAADVDRYCSSENGRCLVFYNTKRWPDYDEKTKIISHADHVRIAIPPSDGFACPTESLVQMRQAGMTDDEMLNVIHNDDALSGYSPSPLGEDEIRSLATPHLVAEDDFFMAMQVTNNVPRLSSKSAFSTVYSKRLTHRVAIEEEHDAFHAMQHQLVEWPITPLDRSSSSGSIPEDWFLNLQRIVEQHIATCHIDAQTDFTFSVYTWYVDHQTMQLCRTPKIAVLGGNPAEWREDLQYPWRWIIRPDDKVFMDVVQPHSPRADAEDHIAHVILTQGYTVESSVLLSMDFPSESDTGPSVIMRVALSAPQTCTLHELIQRVPLLASFRLNRITWIHPLLTSSQEEFTTWFGLGIMLKILPAQQDEASHDDFSLVQHQLPPITREHRPKHRPVQCSFTEEFLRAVQASVEAAQADFQAIDEEAIENQPQVIQALWERSVDARASAPLDQTEYVRIESWFLDHIHQQRCHGSRITLLGLDFLRWKQLLLETWQDKLVAGADTHFDIIFPDSEDAASGIIAQLIVTQRPQSILRSTLLSVYDSDPDTERNPYTFALVLPDQVQLDDVLTTLQLQNECPPVMVSNHCSLWFGSIPIRLNQMVNVHSGYAFRLVLNRGVLMDLPQLLTLEDTVLRRTLQQAVSVQVHRRPDFPVFVQAPAYHQDLPIATPSDARPEWIQQLQRVFNARHHYDTDSWQPRHTVSTWYLNHDQGHHCDRPRQVTLTDDFFMWRTELIFPWRDAFLRATPFEYWVVNGTTQQSMDNETHVLLGQGLQTNQIPVFLCRTGHTRAASFAHIFPRQMVCRDIARFAVPTEHAHLPITIECRGIIYLWDDPIFLQPGDRISIIVHPAGFETHSPQIADDTSFMQQAIDAPAQSSTTEPERPCFNFNPEAPVFLPGLNTIDFQTEFVQTLHQIWIAAAVSWEEETPSTKVLVWFVDHRFPMPKCHAPRAVQLYDDFTQWEERIKQSWNELLVRTLPLEFTVVDPTPPILEHGIAAHIILIQAPRDDWATSLVSICDPALGPAVPLRMAITTHEHITFEQIVHGVYYDDICIYHAEPAQCVVWYHQRPIVPGHPIPGWSGYSIVLHVNRNPRLIRANRPVEHDEVNLLQRPIASTSTSTTTHEDGELTVDFAKTLDVIDWLDSHFTLPSYDVESVLQGHAHWLPQCTEWLRSEWFQWEGPIDKIRVYYDGSFLPQTDQAGSAAVAFVMQSNQWKFAGAISAHLPQPTRGSYTAELTASLLATKFAYDLTKLAVEISQSCPLIDFVFDSLTVGKQTEGLWQAKQSSMTCHAIRSLICIIEKRWKIRCQHRFVPGHSGDPGNEIADTVANCAAQGYPLQDWTNFLARFEQKHFVNALEWAWGLFAPQLGLRWQDGKLVLPAQPCTQPICSEVLPSVRKAQTEEGYGHINLHLLTCNVLTLLPGKSKMYDYGVGGPARLQSLLAQLHEAEVSIFAFQETRLQTQMRLWNEDYFLIHAPANARGQFGILVGLAKSIPFALDSNEQPHPKGWFVEHDFSVLVAEPRLLILRLSNAFLKCILIAAHAPHIELPNMTLSHTGKIPQAISQPNTIIGQKSCWQMQTADLDKCPVGILVHMVLNQPTARMKLSNILFLPKHFFFLLHFRIYTRGQLVHGGTQAAPGLEMMW